MKTIITLILTIVLADTAFGRRAPQSAAYLNAQRSIIITSPNKHYFLKLVPSKWAMEKGSLVKKRDSYGLAFEAMPDGQIKPLWSYKHWDANGSPDLFLSDDGMNLVEVNHSVKSNADSTAVITYKKGIKVRGYSPSYFGVKAPIRKTSRGTMSWKEYGGISATSTRRGAILGHQVSLQTYSGLRWVVSPKNLSIRRVR